MLLPLRRQTCFEPSHAEARLTHGRNLEGIPVRLSSKPMECNSSQGS
jgi:hypothetical protein